MKNKSTVILISIVSLLFIAIIATVIYKQTNYDETSVPTNTSSELSLQDVKAHNIADNCYAEAGGVVYDLTNYIAKNQLDTSKICGQIDLNLKENNIKIDKITSYKIGILVP